MLHFKHLLTIFFFCLFLQSLSAQSSPAAGFTTDIIAEIEYVEGQVFQLLDAMPEEKFNWKPGEGVRSVGEVFMHIGMGNYFSLSFLGGTVPEGFNPDLDKQITKKADIKDFVTKSYEHVKSFISGLKEEDLEKSVDFFGNKSNGRRMVLLCLYHSHEHLGQSIAYARTNGITPPWSKTQN